MAAIAPRSQISEIRVGARDPLDLRIDLVNRPLLSGRPITGERSHAKPHDRDIVSCRASFGHPLNIWPTGSNHIEPG